MKRLSRLAGALLALMCAVAGGPSLSAQTGARTNSGRLADGDLTLRSGEYYDEYSFQLRAGQRVTFDLTSTDFDPYIIVIAPSDEREENDDWQGSVTQARVEMTIAETGEYRVVVTSSEEGETGAYRLRMTPTGTTTAVTAPALGMRTESGRLASGDRTTRAGNYYDEYTFDGRRGEQVTIDLRSEEFDPFLTIIAPNGEEEVNDDHEGDESRSLLSVELPEAGRYRVQVSSFERGETGNYTLRLQQGGSSASRSAAARPGPRIERGALASGDDTLESGEYVDVYTFEGRPNQRVRVDVTSDDFDTYLIVIPPRGERHENDDAEDENSNSGIEADLTEPGTYRVLVTSFEKGERGDYELRIDVTAAGDGAASGSRDVVPLTVGQTRDGALESGDAQVDGKYRDLYSVEGRAGEQLTVEMSSSDFDTYLTLITPGGDEIENDDADGRQDMSRIDLRLRESGRYRIVTTSYEGDETGRYRLALKRGSATAEREEPAPAPRSTRETRDPDPRGGRVYGVFVGISDYPDDDNDLPYTADDARNIHRAMIRGGGMRTEDGTVLVDRNATVANVRRAFETVAQQAGPNDTFVFFFSGHGDRVRRSGAQAADPDGLDETLSFYDNDITDDEMSQMLSTIRARVTLVALDSCFSGGFSKDVISAPGRMGLFSSEEDVTSGVAEKFRAGGYLSKFLSEAIGDRRGDSDRNGDITAVELSQYLHERFRSDVKSGKSGDDDNFVRTEGPQTGYQHLVVDRGSIGPYQVLFRR